MLTDKQICEIVEAWMGTGFGIDSADPCAVNAWRVTIAFALDPRGELGGAVPHWVAHVTKWIADQDLDLEALAVWAALEREGADKTS